MSKLTMEVLRSARDSAAEVIEAIAGNHDYVHPDNSSQMCQLWDDLNDRYAPPEVVKAMAEEIINFRNIHGDKHDQ